MAPKKRPRWTGESSDLVEALREMANKYRHRTPCFPAPGKTDKETLLKHCGTMHSLLKLMPTLAFKRCNVKAAWQVLLTEVAQWQDREWIIAGTETVMKMCRSLEQKMIHGDSRSPFLKLMGLTDEDGQAKVDEELSDDDEQDKQDGAKQQQGAAVGEQAGVQETLQLHGDDDDDDAAPLVSLGSSTGSKQEPDKKRQLPDSQLAPKQAKLPTGSSHTLFKSQPAEEAEFDWELQKAYRYNPQGRQLFADIVCPEDCSPNLQADSCSYSSLGCRLETLSW